MFRIFEGDRSQGGSILEIYVESMWLTASRIEGRILAYLSSSVVISKSIYRKCHAIPTAPH